MATVVITPEMQRANAEALLGQDPGKFRDPGQRFTAKRFAEIGPADETRPRRPGPLPCSI